MIATFSIFNREVLRFYRQPSRIIGVLGFPLIFWGILGFGFGDSVQINGEAYLTFFFPGTVILVVLFTSIFSSMSLIEDRHNGFLQGVLISPAPRTAIVLGHILGGATSGLIQGLLLMAAYWLLNSPTTLLSASLSLGSLFLVSLALSALGFAFAWKLDSVQGFHGIMNIILMPMWILSGALFAPHGWLYSIMLMNPLYYGLSLFRNALSPDASLASALIFAAVIGVFGLICVGVSVLLIFHSERRST